MRATDSFTPQDLQIHRTARLANRAIDREISSNRIFVFGVIVAVMASILVIGRWRHVTTEAAPIPAPTEGSIVYYGGDPLTPEELAKLSDQYKVNWSSKSLSSQVNWGAK